MSVPSVIYSWSSSFLESGFAHLPHGYNACVNPKRNTYSVFVVGHWSCVGHRVVTNCSHLLSSIPAEVEPCNAPPSSLSSPTVNKCPFRILFSAKPFTFLCFSLMILFHVTASSCSAEVLCSVPEHQKTGVCLLEERQSFVRTWVSSRLWVQCQWISNIY